MALKAMSFCRVVLATEHLQLFAALGLGGSEAATDATSFETFGEDVTKTTSNQSNQKTCVLFCSTRHDNRICCNLDPLLTGFCTSIRHLPMPWCVRFFKKKMRRSLFSFSLFSTVLIPRFIGARITFASLYRHGWLEFEADSSPAKMYNAQICTESIGSFNSV